MEIEKKTAEKEIRKSVFAAEKVIKKLGEIEVDTHHHFSQGVYAREIFIPKGAILTGHIHKYEQLNIMTMGDLSVLTTKGVIRVKAPFTIVSPPGTKRIAYAHEDTIWITIHGTDLKDVDEIEKEFIAHTEAEYSEFLLQAESKKEIESP